MHKPLKIGFVLDDTIDTPDGIQQYILTLGNWLSQRGHYVHYLVGESSRQDISNIHSMARNIKVRFNKNRLSIPLPTKKSVIEQKLKELNLDILHVQMPYSPFFAGRVITAAPSSTKIVGTFHIVMVSWLHEVGAKGLEIMNRQTLKKFDEIVSVSPAAATFANTVFGITSDIVPNTVDTTKFSHKPLYNKPLRVVFLGRLVERKGCEYLLRALKEVKQKYPNLEFEAIIAGKGQLFSKLQKYAHDNNLSNVKFTGFVDEKDKPALLASADIAVFPSTGGESFGIVLIEAMAAGSRVVIGGDNVGYRSVLGTNEKLLVKPQNTHEFAERIHYYLTNEKARNDAHKWLQSQTILYDTNTVGKKIESIYTSLLA
jgi:phosphatidylinositol alpha-mannosyltransferase